MTWWCLLHEGRHRVSVLRCSRTTGLKQPPRRHSSLSIIGNFQTFTQVSSFSSVYLLSLSFLVFVWQLWLCTATLKWFFVIYGTLQIDYLTFTRGSLTNNFFWQHTNFDKHWMSFHSSFRHRRGQFELHSNNSFFQLFGCISVSQFSVPVSYS